MPKLKEIRKIKVLPAKRSSEKNVLEFSYSSPLHLRIGSPVRVVAHTTPQMLTQRPIRFTYGTATVKSRKNQIVKVLLDKNLDNKLTYEVEEPTPIKIFDECHVVD